METAIIAFSALGWGFWIGFTGDWLVGKLWRKKRVGLSDTEFTQFITGLAKDVDRALIFAGRGMKITSVGTILINDVEYVLKLEREDA